MCHWHFIMFCVQSFYKCISDLVYGICAMNGLIGGEKQEISQSNWPQWYMDILGYKGFTLISACCILHHQKPHTKPRVVNNSNDHNSIVANRAKLIFCFNQRNFRIIIKPLKKTTDWAGIHK